MRSACAGETFYKEREGNRYCVLHFPAKEKSVDFEKALRRKLDQKDFDFSGVWFPDELSFEGFEFKGTANFPFAIFSAHTDFSFATFSSDANFNSATFSAVADFKGCTFGSEAYFGKARFSEEAQFAGATFNSGAHFNEATFSTKADLTGATFKADATFIFASFRGEAVFWGATFSTKADFTIARFSATADFSEATFSDYVRFVGTQNRPVFTDTSPLDLHFARMEKPNHVSFHTTTLYPHWFINIDARRFDFINVHWINGGKAKPEIEMLKSKDVSSPHRLLAIACRKLAANSEENDRYREASHFRRMAMDAERLETWRGFGFLRLSWWYWLASGYGERPFQAFLVLLGILIVSAALYTKVGFVRWESRLASENDVATAKRDDVGAPLKFSRALAYSAGVMTLQKPEPRPATTSAQTVVLLETVLGPVQAALLALAIRRKFMR
jgi:hypothetical protein